MVIAFQIILLVTTLGAFDGVSNNDGKLKGEMTGIFLASLAAFIVSVMWL